MYCSHFGLHRLPFNNTPDPTFYYSTPEHEEALATLQYATQERKGFVLVTGDVGAGKTLIGRMFLRLVQDRAQSAVITNTNLNGHQLLAALCAEFGIDAPRNASNLELTHCLQEYLLEQFAQDRYVIVVLDEGQNLPDEAFEELRMLGNLEADDAKLLQVCVLGQPELRTRFKQPNMKQLDQRLFCRFHLPSLDRQQTESYIRHRLTVAGSAGNELFTAGAIDEIHAASKGTPRLINRICDNALLTAYGQDKPKVDEAIVDMVLDRDHALRHRPSRHTPALVATAACAESCESGPDYSRTDERIEEIYGSRPELTELPADAAGHWSAARETLDRERADIQRRLDDAVAQCRDAQDKMNAISERAIPADRLEEMQQTYERQTQDVLQKVEHYRTELSNAFDQAHRQWEETRDRVQASASTAASVDDLRNLDAHWKDTYDTVSAQIERFRNQVVALIHDVEAQRAENERQLQSMEERHARSQAEALERISQRMDQQGSELHDLETLISGQLSTTSDRITVLQRESASIADLQQLRNDHAQAVRTITEKFQAGAETLATIQSELNQITQRVPAPLQPAIDALSRRTRAQVKHIRQIRKRLIETHASTLTRMTQLTRQFARHEDLEELRDAQQAKVEGILRQIDQDRQVFRESFASREALDQLRHDQDRTGRDIETLRQEVQQQSRELLQRVEASRSDIQILMDALERRCRFAEEALESLANDQAESDEAIETLRTRREEDIAHLRRQIDRQRESIDRDIEGLIHSWQTCHDRIETLESTAVDAAEFDTLRDALAADMQRIDAAMSAHRDDTQTLVNEANEQLRHLIECTTAQNSERIDQLRVDFAAAQEHNEEQRTAGIDALRRSQQEQAAEILGCIERNRGELQDMISDVVDRCQSAQEQIGSIAMAQIGNQEDLTRLRHQQQSDINQILEQVEAQRQHADREIEQLIARMKQTQDRIEAIQDHAADSETVKELCERQTRDTQQIFDTLGQQREKTETLIADVNGRLDEITTLVEALPDDIATTGHIEKVREESTAQYNEMISRLEQESTAYRQEMADLNQRWEDLTQSLQELAASALGTETFREAEQAFTDGLSRLDGRVTQITGVQQECLRTVIQKVQQMSDRLHTLEDRKPPEPVRIELTPKVGTHLADLIKAARAECHNLESLFDRARETAEHLDRSATHMTDVMQNWEARVDDVQKQCDQLRSSASIATDLMKAMKRCNEAVDAKLRSERWQVELKRAEDLQQKLDEATSSAARQLEQLTHNARSRFKQDLEDTTIKTMRQLGQLTRHAQTTFQQLTAAMQDVDRAEEHAEAWTRRRADAEQLSDRLGRLLQRFERTITRRQEMLVRVAQSTADLADVIQSAGTEEEQRRPAPAVARREDTSNVTEVRWPALRTHAAHAS